MKLSSAPSGSQSSRNGVHLPKQVDIHSRAFGTLYRRFTAHHESVFDSGETDTQALSAKEFVEEIDDAPELHQLLAAELTTLIQEYEKNDWEVNGDPLWEHQKALVFEFVQKLAAKRGNRPIMSVLMEEAPGTGKTRIMGIIIQALSRLMVRGLFDGNILVLVKRKAMVGQQSMSVAERREAVMTTDLTKEREKQARDQYKYFDNSAFISLRKVVIEKNKWLELARRNYETIREAREAFVMALEDAGTYEDVMLMPNVDALLDDIAHLLARRGGVIRAPKAAGINGTEELEVIRLGPPQRDTGKKGDFLFGVPDELMEGGAVHLQSNFDFKHAPHGEKPDENTRIAVLSRLSLLQHNSRVAIRDYLSGVRFIFADEAGLSSDGEIANIVMHPDVGGKRQPFVFAATAFNRGGRLHYDAELSKLGTEAAVNSDDGVLQPQRLVCFPGNEEELLPSGSLEAADQMIERYVSSLSFPERQGVPQPHDGHSLIVVPKDLVPYVVAKLRSKGLGKQVISCDDNGDEQYNAVLQAAMNDPKAPPICLVGSTTFVIDSFDWRLLQSTWMCAPESKQDHETLIRLFGRQFHSAQKNGYIVQQRFSDSLRHNSLPWNAYRPDMEIPEGDFDFVQGRHFIGARRVAAEQRQLQSKPVETEPLSGWLTSREYAKLPRGEGTYPPTIGTQRETAGHFAPILPPLSSPDAVEEMRTPAYVQAFISKSRLPANAAADILAAVADVQGKEALAQVFISKGYEWKANAASMETVI